MTPADLMFSEDLLPGSQMAVFLLCPHRVERDRELSGFFYKGTDPLHGGSTVRT